MRSETVIFSELEALCRSPGYIHAIGHLSARDTMFHYEGEAKPEDLAVLHAPNRLIRNEVNALVGLMVKGDIDFTTPDAATHTRYVAATEALLEEMHHAIAAPAGMSPNSIVADQRRTA